MPELGRRLAIYLFKDSTEITLVGETGFLRYFLYAHILIGKEADCFGHPELVDIIANADAGKQFQLVVKRSTAHRHPGGNELYIQVRIGEVAADQFIQFAHELLVGIADRIGLGRYDLFGFLITVPDNFTALQLIAQDRKKESEIERFRDVHIGS